MTEINEFGYFRGYRCRLITLSNNAGFSASFTDFGATVQSLKVPDRHGKSEDVILGYDTLEEYAEGNSCHGATVGRFANRIGGAQFALENKVYELSANDGSNTLHGGFFGFNKRVWDIKSVVDGDQPYVEFFYRSPDMEEHFPGNLDITVKYTLLKNGLRIEYTAFSDRETVVNLTNHSYFNLKGEGNGNIRDHVVSINAMRFTPVDEELIPTGELMQVALTPYDFTKPKRVGEDMDNGSLPNGYDNNFVLVNDGGRSASATVYEETSGRYMVMATDMPGVQFYIGIGLDNEPGKSGHVYEKFGGLCLESQFFPDSPNQPAFPSCVLKPGEKYYHSTSYVFSII